MKLRDLKDIEKDDILAALGLQTRTSTISWALGTLGFLGLGLVIGAGVALMVAPKPGTELRRELESRLRSMRERVSGNGHTLDTGI